MHPRTVGTLRQLEQVAWFGNVGIKDTEHAIVLSSWKEAISSCSSIEWENHLLDGANWYTLRLSKLNPERFDRWNDVVDKIEPVVVPLIERKTRDVIRRNDLPRVFLDRVIWDVLHVCMEAEY